MTTAVVYGGELPGTTEGDAPTTATLPDQWTAALRAAGIEVLAVVMQCSNLVQIVQIHAPDVIVCHVPQVDEAFFNTVALLQSPLSRPVPLPLLLFTQTDNAECAARAIACGVHAYVVNGYAPQRLKALVTLAKARCQHEQALQTELLELTRRFDERKAVDRAKGILMHARQVSDDDAYRMLRTASMHSNQRLGEVSQQVIESAHFADAVNRAGQLRMLSQRLVKLYVLQVNGAAAATLALHKSTLKASVKRVDETLSLLDKSLSSRNSVLGGASAVRGAVDDTANGAAPLSPSLQSLHALLATWLPLKKALQGAPQTDRVESIDLLAEQLLQEAERLTLGLEQAGAVAPLRVLNLAGRQRMLSQRFAKQALLAAMNPGANRTGDGKPLADTPPLTSTSSQAATQIAFEKALQTLIGLPLTTPAIRSALGDAAVGWQTLLAGAVLVHLPAGRNELAEASESLLDVFEALSTHYERSMQMLMG